MLTNCICLTLQPHLRLVVVAQHQKDHKLQNFYYEHKQILCAGCDQLTYALCELTQVMPAHKLL